MFKFFAKEKKCPICGMAANQNFIAKYGEKFCSANCLKEYERKNQIASSGQSGKSSCGCCH